LTNDLKDEPRGATPFRTWPYFLSGSNRIAAWHAAQVAGAAHH
jgi:hypothetical protein